MKLRATWIVIGLAVGAGHALAQDVPLTDEEFQSLIVGKNLRWHLDDGKFYEVQLAPGGKSTVSGPYNDVGKWRGNGPGAYCNSWNKQTLTETCVQIARRDGALIALRPDGTVRGTVVSVK